MGLRLATAIKSMCVSMALGTRHLAPKGVTTTAARAKRSATSVRPTAECARPQPSGFVV